MTDNMILMWKDLMAAMFTFIDKELLDFVFASGPQVISPESFIEHMLLEFSKYAYHKKAPKHPLRFYLPYDWTDNTERMVYSRTMKYTQKFKDRNYKIMESLSDDPKEYAELKSKPMDTIANRKEGYELTEMDFFEANTIHDLELVKAIAENRIYSSKKTSNDRFTDLFNNYDEWVQDLIVRSKNSDEDLVFSSIAFFTFEWKYAIEYYYRLATYLIDNDIETVDFYSTWLFTGTFNFDSMLGITVGSDSRLVKNRIELIPVFFDKTNSHTMTEFLKRKYIEILTIQALMCNMPCSEGGKYIDWFCENTTMTDLASFFRAYDVFRIWQPKSFDNKLIKRLRYVFEVSSTFNKQK